MLFSNKERDIHEAGLVTVLKEMLDEIDACAFAAYGWDDLAERIVGKPGATLPSPHKSEDQEAAEEELLSRLVALNVERQKEETAGHVRWLRPDYQIAKLGDKAPKPSEAEQVDLDVTTPLAAAKTAWPKDQNEQIRIVRDMLVRAPAPAAPDDLSAAIDGRSTQKRKDRIAEVLDLLVSVGGARRADAEAPRYFVPR